MHIPPHHFAWKHLQLTEGAELFWLSRYLSRSQWKVKVSRSRHTSWWMSPACKGRHFTSYQRHMGRHSESGGHSCKSYLFRSKDQHTGSKNQDKLEGQFFFRTKKLNYMECDESGMKKGWKPTWSGCGQSTKWYTSICQHHNQTINSKTGIALNNENKKWDTTWTLVSFGVENTNPINISLLV